MQSCRGSDFCLSIAEFMTGLADGGIAICAVSRVSQDNFQGRAVGKALGAWDFLEGGLKSANA